MISLAAATPVATPGALNLTPSMPMTGVSGAAYAVGVLVLVCVAAWLTVKFLYGRGPMNRFGFGKQLVRVVDRYQLAAQRYLLTVEIGGKYYLLGVTEQSINMLTQLDGDALAKDITWSGQNETGIPFNTYLSALSRRWKRTRKEPPSGV